MADTNGNDIKIDVCGVTDVGRVRKNNQDYFALVDLSTDGAAPQNELRSIKVGDRGTLLLVSDGMGGEAAGDVASRRSVETVAEEMVRWKRPGEGDAGDSFAKALEAAVQRGNEVVSRESDENPAFRGMGATMTAAGVLDGNLYLVQVGDSRCYLRSRGDLIQVTRDQSLVGQLLVEGRITKEEAERHPHRNIILQALGKAPVIHAEVVKLPLRRGDEILMCSDGLSGPVRDEEILGKLKELGDLPATCRDLIQMANDRGGSDNITAVVARFDGPGLPEATDGDSRSLTRLREFNFAGEEEEETQETFLAPETTAVLQEAQVQAALAQMLEPTVPPGPAAPPAPLPASPAADAAPPVAVSALAMVLVLVSSIAAGVALSRMFAPTVPLPPPAAWDVAPMAPAPPGAPPQVEQPTGPSEGADLQVPPSDVDAAPGPAAPGAEGADPAGEAIAAPDAGVAAPATEEPASPAPGPPQV